MSLTDSLSPVIEAQIHEIAARHDIEPQTLKERLYEHFAATPAGQRQQETHQAIELLASQIQAERAARRADQAQRNAAAIALLRAWREEDTTQDHQEIARRDEETRRLMAALDADRTSDRPYFP